MKNLVYLFYSIFISIALMAMGGCAEAASYEPISADITQSGSDSNQMSNSEITEPVKIYVSVLGEVVSPGVYILEEGARVFEALNLAGGITEDADVSNINLVDFIEDGTQINVPGFDSYVNNASGEIMTNHSGKVNINKASLDELKSIPGIGDTRAKAIIEYREKNGAFSSIEDIMLVSGIKETIFEKIKGEIYVD